MNSTDACGPNDGESYLCLKPGCEREFGTQRGMKTHVSKSHDPKPYMLTDINLLWASLGRKPTKREYNAAGLWSSRSIADHYGSFNDAIREAGFDPTPPNPGATNNTSAYTEDAVREAVENIVEELGRFPKISEFDGQTEMTSKAVLRRFGDDAGWYESLEIIVGPEDRPTHSRDDYGHVEQNEVKAEARRRDDHNCRVCDVEPYYEGWDVHPVHHITPLDMCAGTELAVDLDNLITLCAKCHELLEWKWIDTDHEEFEQKARRMLASAE